MMQEQHFQEDIKILCNLKIMKTLKPITVEELLDLSEKYFNKTNNMKTREQTTSAINLFDYMSCKFNAIYDMTGPCADSIYGEGSPYIFEKLNYMARVIEEDFDGDFRSFVDSLKMQNVREYYTIEELKEKEFTA